MRIGARGPDLPVRAARLSDIPRLAALERKAFMCDRLSAHDWRRILARPTATVLVLDHPAYGLCGLLAGERRRTRLYLNSLAIDERARRHGGAAELLAEFFRDGAERGCSHCILEVRQDNAGARRLYAKMGFRKVGAARAWYADGANAWRLRRALPVGF